MSGELYFFMDCNRLKFSDFLRMEIGVDVRRCMGRVVVFSGKHKNLRNSHGIMGGDLNYHVG